MPGLQRTERPLVRYRTPSPQRDRSPPRRQPEVPAQRSIRITGSNAITVKPRVGRQENQEAPPADPFRFKLPPKPAVSQYMLLQDVNAKADNATTREPLGQIANGNSTSFVKASNNGPGNTLGNITNGKVAPARKPADQSSATANQQRPSTSDPQPIKPIALSSQAEPEVEDPHFVLGVGKGK